MSSAPPIRIARRSFTLPQWAGVFSAVVALATLAAPTSFAQNGKPAHPGAAPRSVFQPRPAIRQAPSPQPHSSQPKPEPVTHVAPAQPVESHSLAEQAPAQQRPLPQVSAAPAGAANGNRAAQNQLHIGQWMEAHRHLPLADQQRALENEPGFRSLRPQEQQQLHQRLSQLNNMSPTDRSKLLDRTESMERLAPVQRQQVRNAMAQLGSIPEERRHLVSRQFFQLRDMPPAQRQSFMESPQYRGQFNEQERTAIGSLLNVAPIYAPLQAQPAQPAPPR